MLSNHDKCSCRDHQTISKKTSYNRSWESRNVQPFLQHFKPQDFETRTKTEVKHIGISMNKLKSWTMHIKRSSSSLSGRQASNLCMSSKGLSWPSSASCILDTCNSSWRHETLKKTSHASALNRNHAQTANAGAKDFTMRILLWRCPIRRYKGEKIITPSLCKN